MKKLVIAAALLAVAATASAADVYGGVGVGGGNERAAQVLVGTTVYETFISSAPIVLNAEASALVSNQNRGNAGLAAFLIGGRWQPFLKLSEGGTGFGIGLGAQRDFEKAPLSLRAEVEGYSKFAGRHANIATVSIIRFF